MRTKLLLLISGLMFAVTLCNAQMTILHNFTNQEFPQCHLLQIGNVFYGTTLEGGANKQGYVFSMNKDGSGFKDLWDFKDTGTVAGNYNGSTSRNSLILLRNRLYGMTYNGGEYNEGVIFSISINGGGYKDLWDFTSATGTYPCGALTLAGNKFYGVTASGGASGEGVVFSVDTNGNNYIDMHDFSPANGYDPYGSLVVSGKTLFGTTENGGTGNEGTVYSIDTAGSNYKTLVNFNNFNGAYPEAALTLAPNGTRLFGTCEGGGSGFYDGSVFELDTNGNNFKTIFAFNYLDGEEPLGEVTLVGSKLYAMTDYGGEPYFLGNIFVVDTTGTGFQDLYNFDAVHGQYPTNGNDVIVSGDTIWGIVYEGGTNGYGVIYQYLNTPNGINTINADDGGLKVYPNPSNGAFTFQSTVVSGQPSEVEVYNMMGQQVYSQTNIPNSTFRIDLSNQANGVYLYRLISLDGSIVGEGKLILQK